MFTEILIIGVVIKFVVIMVENVMDIKVLLSALLPRYDNVWRKLKELTIKNK